MLSLKGHNSSQEVERRFNASRAPDGSTGDYIQDLRLYTRPFATASRATQAFSDGAEWRKRDTPAGKWFCWRTQKCLPKVVG